MNWIEKAILQHPHFDYTKTVYVNRDTPLTIGCPIHGDVTIKTPMYFLKSKWGCPLCARENNPSTRKSGAKTLTESDIRERIKEKGYIYISHDEKYITFNCPFHGVVTQNKNNIISGKSICKKCATEKRASERVKDISSIVESRGVHFVKRDSKYYWINCDIHGEQRVSISNLYKTTYGCPKCGLSNCGNKSSKNSNIELKIKELFPSCEENVIGFFPDNREVDIYLRDLKIAIEVNGSYWHSEIYKQKNYHQKKKDECSVPLIHVWEWDIVNNFELLKRRLESLTCDKKIFARKCKVVEVSKQDKKDFLNANHIQGNCASSYDIGLEYEGNLVSIMTFGKSRFTNHDWELIRFCSNIRVVGGASKLFKHFVNNKKPIEVLSYANYDWSQKSDSVYEKMGFTLEKVTVPDYVWCNSHNHVLSRYQTQMKNEIDEMRNRGYFRVFKSGNLKYIWKNNSQ